MYCGLHKKIQGEGENCRYFETRKCAGGVSDIILHIYYKEILTTELHGVFTEYHGVKLKAL